MTELYLNELRLVKDWTVRHLGWKLTATSAISSWLRTTDPRTCWFEDDDDDDESVPSSTKRQDLRQGTVVQCRIPRQHVDSVRARWRRRCRATYQRSVGELRSAFVWRRCSGWPNAEWPDARLLRWDEVDRLRQWTADTDERRHDRVLGSTSDRVLVVAATSRPVCLDLSPRSVETTARRAALSRRRLCVRRHRREDFDLAASASAYRAQRVCAGEDSPTERTTSPAPSPAARHQLQLHADYDGDERQWPRTEKYCRRRRGRHVSYLVIIIIIIIVVPHGLGADENSVVVCRQTLQATSVTHTHRYWRRRRRRWHFGTAQKDGVATVICLTVYVTCNIPYTSWDIPFILHLLYS